MKIYHVTEILAKYVDFSRVPDLRLYEATQRGRIVHAACVAFALGAFVKPLPAAFSGYFQSFVDWFDINVVQVVLAEQTFLNEGFGFTGRPDLLVKLIGGEYVIVDLKTPVAVSGTWQFQLAAYWYLLDSEAYKIDYAASLRLRPNGGRALATTYSNWKTDFNIFLNALNAHRGIIGDG